MRDSWMAASLEPNYFSLLYSTMGEFSIQYQICGISVCIMEYERMLNDWTKLSNILHSTMVQFLIHKIFPLCYLIFPNLSMNMKH